MAEGQWFRLLRVLPADGGYVAQLRREAGATIPPHRHTGTVHALNLQGMPRLHGGGVIGPGDYVFEPVGNTDSWQAVGDEPLVVHIQVAGDIEYLDERGEVAARYNARVMAEAYRRYCEANSLPMADIGV